MILEILGANGCVDQPRLINFPCVDGKESLISTVCACVPDLIFIIIIIYYTNMCLDTHVYRSSGGTNHREHSN